MPYYSIIIPTYNSEKTIKQCLDSILNQTFRDFEILIMDNLSNDNTISIITEYDDSRIKIHSAKDNGVYDAMNKGIDQSSGDWLYFLGSDDYFYNFKVLNDIFNNISFKDKVIYGSVLISGNTFWANDKDVYDGFFSLQKLLKKNICHQAIFYNKSIFVNKKYNSKYIICADWDFCLYCYSKYSFKYINIIVSVFKTGGVSSSSNVQDDLFVSHKWNNILDYFGYKILKKEFRKYSKPIYIAAKEKKFFIILLFYYLYIRYKKNEF